MRPILRLLLAALLGVSTTGHAARAAESARATIVRAILADDDAARREILSSLMGNGDEAIPVLLTAWREDSLFIHEAADGVKTPVLLTGEKDAGDAQAAFRVSDGAAMRDAAGQPLRLVASTLTAVEHDGALRRAMKAVLDLQEVGSHDPVKRAKAIQQLGFAQNADKLPILHKLLGEETDGKVRVAIREAIALVQLKDPADDVRLAALRELEALHTFSCTGFVETARTEATDAGKPALARAATNVLHAVEKHRSTVDFVGTVFRGVSLGSILLVVALGLAITFGLMGVINMAHGEMIAVGAYSTYVVQNIFGTGLVVPFFGFDLALPGMHLQGAAYSVYFIVALPVSFLAAAIVGVGLERSVIQFLYRRPLESLLATWGVSLVMQQVFRLMFGSNNVQVSNPSYLSGNWTFNDITFAWNRVFVVGFAVLIVIGIWLVLTKTSLGLLMRAVMQNRGMASCMGVRTERVNMLTFGLGSGLAGLAGAFVSQINNVGPSLGQSYIVDSFMVVVLGGVGSIGGTVVSSIGIGGVDNILQQYLPAWAPGLAGVPYIGNFLQNLGQDSAVFGKILVLSLIILFLQWRPAGIFVTRSRSLEG